MNPTILLGYGARVSQSGSYITAEGSFFRVRCSGVQGFRGFRGSGGLGV